MQSTKNILEPIQFFDLPTHTDYKTYWQSVQDAGTRAGASYITGPIEGNTWQRYRTVIASSGAPAFMLEPHNKNWKDYVSSGIEAGFNITATYASSVCDLSASLSEPDFSKFSKLTFKPFDMAAFDQQLMEIYQLSCQSFVKNYLYSAISEEQFLALYAPLKPFLAKYPELTELVYDDGQLVGLCLVLADCLDNSGKTAILKTLMRQGGNAYKGLGLALVQRAILRSQKAGFAQLILALYKEDGMSAYIANLVNATVIRRYGLLSKSLKD